MYDQSEKSSLLKLHDTLSGSIKALEPSDGKRFRFYCCGPTVYGPAHIGNFRTFLLQDVFRRALELTGMTTHHVRNITDVDDKTIQESQAKNISLNDFTEGWSKQFHDDCDSLNMLHPHDEPAAVAHMDDILNMIQTLMDQDLAYQAEDGSVYFRISKFPAYGKLSRLDERELKHQEKAISSDEYEDSSVADFALWKAQKDEDGPNVWQSPWGPGRPGWHIECSAMSVKYLGTDFDLHAGGIDLIFPHHDNEIAQSEGATGSPFARHWFHTAHLMINGGKMSKSLGTLYTLDDIEAQGFVAADLRYALIAGHYRKPLNYTDESLHAAQRGNQRLAHAREEFLNRTDQAEPASYKNLCSVEKSESTLGCFYSAWTSLLDQLNTPQALGQIFSALGVLEKEWKTAPDAKVRSEDATGFFVMLEALGLNPQLSVKAEVPADVAELAEKRWQARVDKNWAESDALRDQLTDLGWKVKDQRDRYELEAL